ncbi:peptidase S8 [Pantoea agglomerans]|uniref:S8 family peptidase n=1 Tax=Enterobacter agglomerans TaxID=549 RepID=UPI000B3493B5|nr:S8 family serine peptidase [Pantoea agglomerans]PHP91521.1 peptidase S8 [Pantoea agglomerans]
MKSLKVVDKKNENTIIKLKKSDAILAIRFRAEHRNLSDKAASDFFQHHGVEILYHFSGSGSFLVKAVKENKAKELKDVLRKKECIEYVGNAYLMDGYPVVYTGNIIVMFHDSESEDQCLTVLSEKGFIVKNKMGDLGNVWLVEHSEKRGDEIFELSNNLGQCPEVEFCYPEVIQRNESKIIHRNQWHLKPTVVSYSAYINASANVASAHELTRGAGVKIAIIDGGIDITHPEFSGENKITAPANFEAKKFDNNPMPGNSDESHGTACAGVALASGRFGASGVAPDAVLIPIRLHAALGSFNEAQTFIWAAQNGADIISCSWGPVDGDPLQPDDPYHFKKTPLFPLTKRAIDFAVKHGRNGKGCAIFFAAGNGNESVDNDGYASYINVMAVAACNDKSRRSYYSDQGKAIFCCFPSSDLLSSQTRGIWTTDVTGQWGYNPTHFNYGDEYGNFTNSFGGTSSACPGAAGVAALVLSVNDSLTLNELKKILKSSCEKIDPEKGNYNKKGHSKLYGYGRLDAEKAVKLAIEYKNIQSELSHNVTLFQPVK